MTRSPYRNLLIGLIAAWFVLVNTLSALHRLQTAPGKPPLPLLLAVVTPIAIFVAWYWNSASFREYVLSLNPQTLTIVQAWRTGGVVFLTLYALGILPGLFALPAGLGDMMIGFTAPWAAAGLAGGRNRAGFIRWQSLGILDLVVAVSMGAAAGLLQPQGRPTTIMTMLPMSLIPTFLVPFFLILHIISIAQARRWEEKTQTQRLQTSLA